MLRKVKEEFSKIIAKKYGLKTGEVMQSFSIPKEEFGELSTNIAFVICKKEGKTPKEIGEQIVELLKKNRWVEESKVIGPYVNIFLSNGFYSSALEKTGKEKEKYGAGKKKKEKIMVEFFHANTHKGVHVGHIRNISIGESLSRILEFNGNKVIRANYQGDIGPHVAKCLWGFINLYNQKAPEDNRGIWLGKVYAEASKRIEGDKELENQVQEINNRLYANDREIVSIWNTTREWCLEDFEKFYKEFGVDFNELYFESQTEGIGKKIVLELLKKGIVKEDQGAIVIDLKEEGLGVFVLLTKEGYPLYSTKDIGLVKIKFDKYKLTQSIHVVGKEQELYFKQLFKTFEKIGCQKPPNKLGGMNVVFDSCNSTSGVSLMGPLFKNSGITLFRKAAESSYHLIYELVMLPEGKMSSREGTMVLYEELKEKLLKVTTEETRKRHEEWPKELIEKTAKEIALSAIKFSMLKRECNKQLIFDWKEALNLEGDSGPHLQYAYVRTRGILEKTKTKPMVSKEYKFNQEEKRVIKKLCEFPEIVEKSAESKIVHNVPEYLLDLASDFNKFYATSPVLREEGITKDSRLAIVNCCGVILKNGLRLMGIKTVERM